MDEDIAASDEGMTAAEDEAIMLANPKRERKSRMLGNE